MRVFDENSNIFKLLSEAISEGVVVVDETQNIVAINKSASEMFGYEDNELTGSHLDILIPKNLHHVHQSYVAGFMTHTDRRQMGHGRDLYGRKKDGNLFPVEAGLNPFVVSGKRYVMALVIDITIRKAQEKEIRELNSQLEQKIEARTKKLKVTVKELQEEVLLRKEAESRMKESLQKEKDLGELKTKFLSLVSHEFKTPLTGMLSSASLASKYTLTEQQEKREKHLNIIKSKIKYLDNILNDFLSIERLETGKVTYKYETFPLSKVINEVVYDANMLLKSGQKIKFPQKIEDYTLSFDEKVLELALSNLISNAIKYSPENTIITLKVEKEGDFLVISVQDQGMGIPEEEQKFIFKRYFRAQNVLTHQGTGIGLNIVQSHLNNLGGTISFISTDTGTTFTMKIPLQPQKS
ncbi:ATP-binding protein [Leeuwenhoekiella sp. A16]|uniref:PAS domain-containing sensor histidine kinase n=1 Tax=unclassified Leeuwenhoekiella TaxID=2615029 RepID=UPI003A80D4E6|tara:strand:+ start:68186 stop:69415 length:1230 start_codon:yes stop_codon:yes gene_type:complete